MHINKKGFTLTELMMVVMIIGVLAAVSTPTIVRALPTYNLRRAAGDVFSNLRKAKSMAIRLNRPVSVRFWADPANPGTHQYAVDNISPMDHYKLPESQAKSKSLAAYYGSGIKFGFSTQADPVGFTNDTITFNALGMPPKNEINKYVYVQFERGSGSKKQYEGYRIGIRGMAGVVVMEKCGGTFNDSGTIKTITCLE